MSNEWWPDVTASSEFITPARVLGGRGASTRVAELVGRGLAPGDGAVLVVADDVVLANGLAEPLLAALAEAGFDTVVSSGFGSEPSDETIDAAAVRARECGARSVVGIGGGSVLDSSKLIALMLRNPGGVADWLGPVDPPWHVAPLTLIPTTCGTGSEATRIAMVSVAGEKRVSSCADFIPEAVIIDPGMVAGLPRTVLASTAMDALAHAVESVFSTARSPLSLHAAFGAIDLLTGNVEAAADGDVDALGRCLWAAFLAGQALNAGVVVGHSLAYCITYEHPMPHGVSCALALPYCIAYNREVEPRLAARLASALTRGGSTRLDAAAAGVLALTERLELPTTLEEAGLRADAEAAMAERCVTNYPRPTNPRPLEPAGLEQLLRAMRTGDLEAAFETAGSAR